MRRTGLRAGLFFSNCTKITRTNLHLRQTILQYGVYIVKQDINGSFKKIVKIKSGHFLDFRFMLINIGNETLSKKEGDIVFLNSAAGYVLSEGLIPESSTDTNTNCLMEKRFLSLLNGDNQTIVRLVPDESIFMVYEIEEVVKPGLKMVISANNKGYCVFKKKDDEVEEFAVCAVPIEKKEQDYCILEKKDDKVIGSAVYAIPIENKEQCGTKNN